MNILRCEFIGEAMRVKNFLFFFLLLIPSILFSQDINIQSLKSMKNEDLKTYLNQAQKEGYSLDQIKIMAKAPNKNLNTAKSSSLLKELSLKKYKTS